MTLAEVIGAITPLLPANVDIRVGEEHLQKHDSPPRIVWVPTPDTFADVRRSDTARYPSPSPVAIKTRMAGVQAHIWAAGAVSSTSPTKDLEAAENLLNTLVAAIHGIAYGAYEILGGEWVAPGMVQKGRVYVLSLRFHVPVTAAPQRSTVITEIAQDVQIGVA